jgi:signal transduction histidine kinase
MKKPLHVLHLEDDPAEAAIARSIFESEKLSASITHVKNRADFVAALESGNFDLIIADYSLPGFDGLSALKITRATWPDLPFILMSGTVGEEFAIESLKSGATDYVLKDRRSRLIPAVHRALREAEERAEHRRLEKQFIQAQKMEAVGQLSSGIAHDFNNILGIIIGNNDYVMGKLHPEDSLRKNLQEIQHAADRATGVIRQLLVFSRNQAVQLVVLDLNEVIQSMDKMIYRLVDEPVKLTFTLQEKIGRIEADSGYIGQLLMNMVINARDAMPDGGNLSVATYNATLDEDFVLSRTGMTAGHFVVLSISDTGVGMTDEVKAKLFEAFFTTKPKGKGTGLGLATCQTIARQSNAYIDVESRIGKGTTFKIYFPRVDQPLSQDPAHLPSEAPPRGTETILLVEDEAALRQTTSMVLESQGYTVLQTANGQEGLKTIREHKGSPISLVITDVAMPKMGGKVMVEWLKTTNPDLKVLFTSGYVDVAMVHHGMPDPEVAFLPKPYNLASLAGKVRELLDGENKSVR